MTLIISSLEPDHVVQVSDRRLTRADGTLFDDQANKALVLHCADAFVTIAYTGLAFIGADGQKTDFWLLHTLDQMPVGQWTLGQVAAGVATQAQAALAVTPGGQREELTFVPAGFLSDGRRVHVVVSNAYRADCTRKTALDEQFEVCARTMRSGLFVHGREQAAEPFDQRNGVLWRNGFYSSSPAHVVAEALVENIREASRTPVEGDFVGRDCMSVAIWPNGGSEARFHPEHANPLIYGPHFVSPGAAFAQAVIRGAPPPSPSADIPFEEWPELPGELRILRYEVTVTNIGAETWEEVRLDLNGGPLDFRDIPRGWFFSTGFVFRLPQLFPGENARIDFRSFTSPRQVRSPDPAIDRPQRVVLTARLPSGEFGKLIADTTRP